MIGEQDEAICLLIFKHLTGTLTDEEKQLLAAWCKEDEAHERLLYKLQDNEWLQREYLRRRTVDTRRPMEDMRRRIRAERFRERRRQWTRWAAAASVTLLLCVGGAVWWNSYRGGREAKLPTDVRVQVADTTVRTIRPGSTQATLTLTDGRQLALGADEKVNQEAVRRSSVAARGERTVAQVRQLCLDVPRGGEFKVVLEDSTEVWLNAESRLTYPESFSGSERRVTVSGEAYFRVAHDESRPFYVETDGQLVRVYGTEFNIRSYSDDREVRTTLVEGSIALCKSGGQGGELLLTPGHQARFAKASEEISVRSVDTEAVTGWRHGRFVFEEQSLEEIMRELSRWYAFDYRFEEDALRSIVFMGSIPRYADFHTALSILEKSGGLRFEVQETTVVVSRND